VKSATRGKEKRREEEKRIRHGCVYESLTQITEIYLLVFKNSEEKRRGYS